MISPFHREELGSGREEAVQLREELGSGRARVLTLLWPTPTPMCTSTTPTLPLSVLGPANIRGTSFFCTTPFLNYFDVPEERGQAKFSHF